MEVVDIRNHHTDLVEEVLEVQEEEAYVHQVVAVDIEDILVLLVVEDNFEEDTVDVHNVDHLEVDEEYIPKIYIFLLNMICIILNSIYILLCEIYTNKKCLIFFNH